MSAFNIKITGIDEEIAKLKRLPEVLLKDMDFEVSKAAMEWVAQAKRDAPADMGAIRGSIRNTKVSMGVQKIGVYKDYAVYLEFGTKGKYRPIPGTEEYVKQFQGKGGKAGGKGFYDNILRWVKRKGITGTFSRGTYNVKTRKEIRTRLGSKVDQQIEDEQVAFAIYLSIMRHGIKPQPFFFKQREIVIPTMIKRMQDKVNSYG